MNYKQVTQIENNNRRLFTKYVADEHTKFSFSDEDSFNYKLCVHINILVYKYLFL